ncbi:MAG: lysozyme inhibitor LprI family protein [Myxococcota bacterium]
MRVSQTKQQRVDNVGQKQVNQAHSTQAPQATQKRAQAAAPDLDHAVPRSTTQQFAKASQQPRAGQSALSTRIAHRDTQAGMNEAAWKDTAKAEKRMDTVAKELTKGWDGADAKDMRAEQKAFKEFNSAWASFDAFQSNDGGSIWRTEAAGMAKDGIEARIKFLQAGAEVQGNTSANIPDDATQQEMNALAYESFAAAEHRLKDLEGKIEVQLDDGALNMFRAAQEAFRDFRDATATRVSNGEARGGTLAPLIRSGVAEQMTEQHFERLSQLLKSLQSG